MRPLDTSSDAHQHRLVTLRRMGPARRLRAGFDLTALSRALLAEGIRKRHPEYSPEQVRLAVIRRWLGDELFVLAYPAAPLVGP